MTSEMRRDEPPESASEDAADLVRDFLRGQNLEQLGRTDEARELYEQAVARGFDATGPYDRLIALYADQARHGEVIRIAGLALANVRTHADKRAWYEDVRVKAQEAERRVPPAAPKKRS